MDKSKLKKMMKKIDFDGLPTSFRSNLDQYTKFKGREYGLLGQFLPIALRNIQTPSQKTLAWCITSEVG